MSYSDYISALLLAALQHIRTFIH